MIELAAVLLVGQGILPRLIPHPTGRNGHEEYLRAADLVNRAGFRGRYSDAEPSRASIGALRKTVRVHSQVALLVRAGNRKPFAPVWRDAVNRDTLDIFPLRRVDLILRSHAHLAFRTGRTEEGVSWVLDTLTFGDRISRDTLIHNIVGLSTQSYALNDIAPHLTKLSAPDLGRVESHVRGLLNLRPAILDAAEGERRFSRVVEFSEEPEAFSDDSDVDQEVRFWLSGASSEENASFVKAVRQRVDTEFSRIAAVLRKPEREWVTLEHFPYSAPKPPFSSATEVVEAKVGESVPIWREMAGMPLQLRARLRLLILHAKAERYRRRHGQYPPRLRDFATRSEAADPLSGSEFVYERAKTSFRMYSRGSRSSGRVTLVRLLRRG